MTGGGVPSRKKRERKEDHAFSSPNEGGGSNDTQQTQNQTTISSAPSYLPPFSLNYGNHPLLIQNWSSGSPEGIRTGNPNPQSESFQSPVSHGLSRQPITLASGDFQTVTSFSFSTSSAPPNLPHRTTYPESSTGTFLMPSPISAASDPTSSEIPFKKQKHVTTSAPQPCRWNCDFCSQLINFSSYPYNRIPKGWKHRLVFVFDILEKVHNRKWQHLINDVFPFIESHGNIFSADGFKNVSNKRNWRLTVQDALAHNKSLFESGQSVLHKKGYWRAVKPNETEEEKRALIQALKNSADYDSEEGGEEVTSLSSIASVGGGSIPTNSTFTPDALLSKDFEGFLKRKQIYRPGQ
eukprot:TRINITY_DN8933_c0_g1_i1.p1 TRINITY_DN8933_c0_g1~~TRINITY_DN8933_c0_g1_i1.p1  ORF type:complete len:352 (-),score=47.11 TRINITY_DN8933_c0_g1_i1:16-1071(-)